MTLGEKLKDARKRAGLSQEQLSEKLNVSRSAVAKWETDKGIPDVENLKALSRMLQVSVDYLLDDGQPVCTSVLRESIDLERYGKGRKKVKKDRIMREKFSDGTICTLLAKQKLTRGEKVIDNALGFLTDAPFGIPEFINQVKNLEKEFYLVEQGEKQFLVMVTDEFLERRELLQRQTGKRFEIGNWIFLNCGPIRYV